MSDIVVTISDETATGKVTYSQRLTFPDALVTVAQIIERRVAEEVAVYNERRHQNFFGLVQPRAAEAALNSDRKEKFRPIDVEKQIAVAREAFERNGFFMLIDNHQAEALEQTFVLHQASTISFVKLTPLVGG